MKVREVLRLLKDDGWYVITIKGSHRQFKHPTKRGRVTVAGHPNDDTSENFKKYSGSSFSNRKVRSHEVMQYAMIIEKGDRNYSAYLPDLPGCIATGSTLEEVKQRMHEAVELHLRGMREDGLPIPEPSLVEYVEAA